MNDKIDIILPWVDGADKSWQKKKNDTLLKLGKEMESDNNARFQSWDLKYWFRAVEKNMPWFHKIFLVVSGECPEFLNLEHPRLKIVRHEDYIPEEYLPTFNSNTIEMNFHRIAELSENFVALSDDVFPLQPFEEDYYFRENVVCDEAVETPLFAKRLEYLILTGYKDYNNMAIINKHFDKREVQKKHRDKWYCEEYGELLERTKSMSYWNTFSGFREPHVGFAQKKSTLEEVWSAEPELLDIASRNQFRDYTDVSHWLCRYWRLCKGEFIPRRTQGKFMWVDINNYQDAVDVIRRKSEKMLCLADSCSPKEFEIINKAISEAMEEIFPKKSSFEK